MTIYEKNVSEPWFTLIKLKIKSVEGRLNKEDYKKMEIGDYIIFTNNDMGFKRKFKIKIINIAYYDTFQVYLETETLENCLPGINSMKQGLDIYYKYYTKDDELKYKIKALKFS